MGRIGIAGVAAMLGLGALAAPAHAYSRCDRACLEGFADRVTAAMAAHDPGRVPWASRAHYTENGQDIGVGDGLWGTASAVGRYRLYVADPEAGQIGLIGAMYENGTPVLLALRLRIEDGTVSEAEAIVARNQPGSAFANPGKAAEDRGTPRAQFLRTVPPAQRMSRDELVRIGNSYFTGLAGNTGQNTAPFAPTCLRLENGAQTVGKPTPRADRGGVDILGMSCDAQQKSGFYAFVTSIRDRRFPVVDRERGLVFAFAFFEHQGRIKELRLASGQTIPSPIRAPTTFEIAELFQIDRGKIDQVEAVLNTVPYGMVSDVWDKR